MSNTEINNEYKKPTVTLVLSKEAMSFLHDIDGFWWEVSECTKCHTLVLDSELVDGVEVPNCGCGKNTNATK